MWTPPFVRDLAHPEAGHDAGRKPYFEGWYVKLVSADQSRRLALIPGLFRGQDGGAEAFVQVLDGASGRSWYLPFPEDEYWAGRGRFAVGVENNRFAADGISIDLHTDGLRLQGQVRFTSPLLPWPVSVRSPGAMGWYAYVPFMECYHGVVSFGHGLAGELIVNDELFDLDGGRGYIEQDWGQAFPAGYIWVHSNHFADPELSLMASAAVIPWVRGEFPGLLIGVRKGDRLHRFATYTGAKQEELQVTDHHVHLRIRSRSGEVLELHADRPRGALLHAPIRSRMHQRVEETLDATVSLRLTGRDGSVLIDDTGTVAGLEVHGEIDRLHPS